MYEIVILVCLISDPANCKEERLAQRMAADDPFRCQIQGAPHIAAWMEQNPGWTFKRMWCAPAGSSRT